MDVRERTWLVIPLYNEGTVVHDVIAEVINTFPNIICVDDGSADASAAEAVRAGAHVARHPINLGQGAALQTGITYALSQPGVEYLITFDADGQHRIEDALAMLETAQREDLAFILGSRFLEGKAETGTIKKIVLKTAALVRSGVTTARHRAALERDAGAHRLHRLLALQRPVAAKLHQHPG